MIHIALNMIFTGSGVGFIPGTLLISAQITGDVGLRLPIDISNSDYVTTLRKVFPRNM